MIFTIICAGGTGSRFGSDTPKQLELVDGDPMLLHSIRAFLPFGRVVVGAAPEYFDKILSLSATPLGASILSPAGATRSETIKNALDLLAPTAAPSDVILTHDAARPFVSSETIARVVAAVSPASAATAAIPATDTILSAAPSGEVTAAPARETLFHAQTPQGACFAAMQTLFSGNLSGATDLAGLCLAHGVPIKIVAGDITNKKITYKEDL